MILRFVEALRDWLRRQENALRARQSNCVLIPRI